MPNSAKFPEGDPLQPASVPDTPGPMPANARAAVVPPGQKPLVPPAVDQHPGEPAHPGVPLAPPGIVPESDVRVHTPAAAAPQPDHGQLDDGLGELPWIYGDGRLVALVRDPSTLFVYWDFSPQQIDQAFAGLGQARAVLQLWTGKNGGELVREQEVHLAARSWYVRELPAGCEVRVELWALGEKGARMLRAARAVKLPPSVPSEVLEAFYLRIPLDQPLTAGLHHGRPLKYGGAAPPGWERRLQPRAFGGSSVGSGGVGSPGAGSGGFNVRTVPGDSPGSGDKK